jgi:hypothetical protein
LVDRAGFHRREEVAKCLSKLTRRAFRRTHSTAALELHIANTKVYSRLLKNYAVQAAQKDLRGEACWPEIRNSNFEIRN